MIRKFSIGVGYGLFSGIASALIFIALCQLLFNFSGWVYGVTILLLSIVTLFVCLGLNIYYQLRSKSFDLIFTRSTLFEILITLCITLVCSLLFVMVAVKKEDLIQALVDLDFLKIMALISVVSVLMSRSVNKLAVRLKKNVT